MPLDPVAALMLDEAAPEPGGTVVVVDDRDGALCRALLERGCRVRAYCDDVRDERDLPVGAERLVALGPDALTGVSTVLLRLPTALGGLEEYAQALAAGASGPLHVVAGGRVKHMTRAMNDVLAGSFADVRASLGRQKSRVLHAEGPTPGERTWPRTVRVDELGLTMVAHGLTFSAAGLDAGTRLLLAHLPPTSADAARALDVGGGTGLIPATLARGGYRVRATDVSAAALASTAATAEANGLDVAAVRADGLEAEPEASADLIASNPPFHRGAAKDSTPTARIIADAARVLAPGGQLWLVFNSHLPYLGWLRRDVGPTEIVARDRAFTVTCSTRRP
ncbi:class I SAM-dependent methyltransferase [Nigerium massiliense]|uniref:class I SAM-dependent methyltransferase n=1 Tax=Nigerium massiliense TaxID=1522317 RepID=UPI000694CB24|nr:methyltransferase [Nigerium massiliense]